MKMDRLFRGAAPFWFLLGALWCAAALAALLDGRAPVALAPLLAAAALCFVVGALKFCQQKKASGAGRDAGRSRA